MVAAVVAAVLVVAAGGITAALLLLSGDESPEEQTSTALETAQAYLDALIADDCQTGAKLMTEERRQQSDCDSDLAREDDSDLYARFDWTDPEITSESETKAIATFTAAWHAIGIEIDFKLTLVNQDGEWLVDDVDAHKVAPRPNKGG